MSAAGTIADGVGPGGAVSKPAALLGPRLVARSCEVVAAAPERLLGLGEREEAGFWDARPLGDPMVSAYVGAAWSASLSGDLTSDGFVDAGRSAVRLLERLEEPTLRAFVAVPFEAGRGFVRIPRAQIAVSGDSARLTVVGDPHEEDLEARLATLRTSWDRAGAEAGPSPAASGARVTDDGRDAYARLVGRALEAIEAGTVEKVVTARKVELSLARSPSLSALVAALPTSRVARFLVAQGAEAFFGATPETLVCFRQGMARADALAGSRPAPMGDRASDASLTAALAEELLRSDKDRREHALVVAFVRRALAGLGELLPEPSPDVVRLPSVWHLHTPLAARVRPGAAITDLVASLHPTPAVLGVPPAAARAWLREHEPFARGLYAGSLGTIDARGEGTFVVGIRSGKLSVGSAGREPRVTLYAGGGIVAGSDVVKELDETSAKLAPLLGAFGCGGPKP